MKNHYPKVSIITPSYNQAQFLEKTIRSVLNQDYSNIEYIIIDGGSTDGSVDIIRKYEHRLTYWVSEPDRGQSHAINKGFQRATGEIISWLNSDDEYTPRTISTVVNFFLRHQDVAMVYGDCDIIDEYDRVVGHIKTRQCDLKRLLHENTIPQPTVFFKKKVIEDVGLLNETLNYAMDYDLWLRIGSKYKIQYLPLTLARFRRHTTSKTTSQDEYFWQEVFTVLDNFLADRFLDRTLSDVAYSHMLRLIVYWQKGQIEKVVEFLHCINGKRLFTNEELQNLCLFFDGQVLTQANIKRVRVDLYRLYQAFCRRYMQIHENEKIEKYAHHWINKQMIQLAHYLFDKGKNVHSKRLFWILLKTNLDVLKEPSTFKLLIKYLLTQRGIVLVIKLKGLIEDYKYR